MSRKQQAYRPISREELDEIAGETLSEQAAASLLKAKVAIPVDKAIAPEALAESARSDRDDSPSR